MRYSLRQQLQWTNVHYLSSSLQNWRASLSAPRGLFLLRSVCTHLLFKRTTNPYFWYLPCNKVTTSSPSTCVIWYSGINRATNPSPLGGWWYPFWRGIECRYERWFFWSLWLMPQIAPCSRFDCLASVSNCLSTIQRASSFRVACFAFVAWRRRHSCNERAPMPWDQSVWMVCSNLSSSCTSISIPWCMARSSAIRGSCQVSILL